MREAGGAKVSGCPVCKLPGRERHLVDVGLAVGHGPAWIARRFKSLKRHQVRLHRDRCLEGDALVAVARERGWISEAGLEGEGVASA
jgi:hypothetical protein